MGGWGATTPGGVQGAKGGKAEPHQWSCVGYRWKAEINAVPTHPGEQKTVQPFPRYQANNGAIMRNYCIYHSYANADRILTRKYAFESPYQ